MIKISRRWLAFISITFGLFLTSVGALRFENFNNYLWALSTNLLYVICLLITTLAFKTDRMSTWSAWLNIAAAIYIPIVLHITHIGPVTGDYDTWYVTALAVLFGSMLVREQVKLAIIGTVILVLQVVFWGGFDFVSRSGLAGAIMLVVATFAISTGLDRTAKTISKFQELRAEEQRDSAITERARREHRERITEAIEKAVPTLKEIAKGAKLSRSERTKISALAQGLEDEISGGRLVTPEVRMTVAAARARSIEVTLIDELPFEDQADLKDLLDIATAAIESTNVGRIKLIAPKQERYLLRLTATRPGVVTPDLDLKLGERQTD
jgi:uncharacterized membrane protein YhdT